MPASHSHDQTHVPLGLTLQGMKPHSKVEQDIFLTGEIRGISSSCVSNEKTVPDLVVVDRPLEFFFISLPRSRVERAPLPLGGGPWILDKLQESRWNNTGACI